MRKFLIGDKVHLKSGSPRMEVKAMTTPQGVYCIWKGPGGVLLGDTFPEINLIHARERRKQQDPRLSVIRRHQDGTYYDLFRCRLVENDAVGAKTIAEKIENASIRDVCATLLKPHGLTLLLRR